MREGLEKLLAQGKDGALLRFGLGNAFLQEANYASAAEHLEQAVIHNPQYSAAWKLLGKAYLALDKPAQAEQAWAQGMQVAQANGDAQTAKEITVFLKRLHKKTAP